LLKSQAAETIFSNSALIVMLNQAPGDRAALARLLNISETQQQYINNARKGSGLIWTGQSIIPFYDEFPTNTRLYALMSTNATENLQEMVANERMSRNRQALSEKEKADQEYLEYQKQQAEFYKDAITPGDEETPAVGESTASNGDLMNDMDDYPDDGFGPDPFALSFSEGGFKKEDDEDDIFADDDDEMPDEFDSVFGGGVNSMFGDAAKKGATKETKSQQPAQQTKPQSPKSDKPSTGNKNQDALNSFFNI
jgi:hypothetical protein